MRSVLNSNGSNNPEPYEWIITYKRNTFKHKIGYEKNEEEFIDLISRQLNESFGSSTATITDSNIIDHYIENYISSLISCKIIHCQSSTSTIKDQRHITEFTRFNPHISKATAICSHTDIKITIVGNNLDFFSSHKKMCIITSENLFQPNSVITASEISRNKLVLMNNSLLPVEKRVTIGSRKYTLDTHFGEINLILELYDDDTNNGDNQQQQTTSTFHIFNANFLMATFLRSFFECLHANYDLSLSNKNSSLHYFAKLVANRLPENPGRFLLYGTGALVGICVLFHAGLISLIGYPLFADTLVSGILTQFGVVELSLTYVGTITLYSCLANVGCNSLNRFLYHEHLAFLLNSMGSDSDECANEKMLETQLCDILEKKSIDFDATDMRDRKIIKKIIKDKHLFHTKEITHSKRLTLDGTTIDSQMNAFGFLHDIYYICKLRRSMTGQYISFIGAHRAGKSSLLKSLWNIPAQRGDYFDNRTQQIQMYTLYDDNSSNKVHLLDFPGLTDPVQTIAHLNQNYCVFSTFYVIVVRAGTDYNSAAELIKELQTSPTITSPSETKQLLSNATTTTQSKLVDEHVSIDQQNRGQQQYGLNKSAKFVVIITGIDTIPDSLIENELNEAINRRLNINKELICLCYNKEAIDDENFLRSHESRNLPGIFEVRTFLNKHFNQILDKHSDFNTYKYSI
ncbi:unnamed protein product [Didymodactylos carnosus]|uniref:G domain-containing protein n=1 Tax=Didymodactylos carnosus TaxID=1234261 RepID=A0A815H9A8_9BILA|nr:unnamed protein product [Didymodactylos carnosus]CAF1351044.1 unnamed protein product [Didymodactylos carnosus]CAF4087117.1 unnamed protein product [Didymodactylos carnosus]CAF4221025.1 unnamed protein product [Didymodactylos carnosus]